MAAVKEGKRNQPHTFVIRGIAVMFWRDKEDPNIAHAETLLRYDLCPEGLALALGGAMTARRTMKGRYANRQKVKGWFWNLTATDGDACSSNWAMMGWLPPKQQEMFK